MIFKKLLPGYRKNVPETVTELLPCHFLAALRLEALVFMYIYKNVCFFFQKTLYIGTCHYLL
jgi:hypothetical protein